MAETVLYLLNSTDDSTRIAIQPRTFDGVGGVQRNTDLTLYGNGAPKWGERFDENFYRLMEHFAVAEKSTLPIRPQDENDLVTVGLGINNPIQGQVWFNKDRLDLYVYTGLSWNPAGKVGIVGTTAEITSNALVAEPREGELAYSTNAAALMIYNGSTWVEALQSVPLSRAVNTAGSLQGGGQLNVDRTLTLVNDQINPGSTYYYGTNGVGTKGFHPFPSGGTVTNVAATTSSSGLSITGGNGSVPGGAFVTSTGTLSFNLSAELQGLANISGGTGRVRRAGVGSYVADGISSGEITSGLGYTPTPTGRGVYTTGSLQGGGNFTTDRTLLLVGDSTSPGVGQYYGTNNSGTKGFFPLSNYSSIGVSQSWSITGKNKNITYTNSTGRPIQVMVTMNIQLGGGTAGIHINGSQVAFVHNGSSGDNQICFSFIVPPGNTYSAFGTGGRSTVYVWSELS